MKLIKIKVEWNRSYPPTILAILIKKIVVLLLGSWVKLSISTLFWAPNAWNFRWDKTSQGGGKREGNCPLVPISVLFFFFFLFMVSRSYQNRLCGFGVDALRFKPILHFTGWTHVSIFLNTWHACMHTCMHHYKCMNLSTAYCYVAPKQEQREPCQTKHIKCKIFWLNKFKVLFHNSRLFY